LLLDRGEKREIGSERGSDWLLMSVHDYFEPASVSDLIEVFSNVCGAVFLSQVFFDDCRELRREIGQRDGRWAGHFDNIVWTGHRQIIQQCMMVDPDRCYGMLEGHVCFLKAVTMPVTSVIRIV